MVGWTLLDWLLITVISLGWGVLGIGAIWVIGSRMGC
jgi:hypothetical protein